MGLFDLTKFAAFRPVFMVIGIPRVGQNGNSQVAKGDAGYDGSILAVEMNFKDNQTNHEPQNHPFARDYFYSFAEWLRNCTACQATRAIRQRH